MEKFCFHFIYYSRRSRPPGEIWNNILGGIKEYYEWEMCKWRIFNFH